MRKVKLTLLSVIITIIMTSFYCELQAQKQIIPDARLYEIMGQQQVDMMLQLAPEKIAHYNCFLNFSFYISSELPKDYVLRGDIATVTKKNDDNQYFNEDFNLVKSNKINRLKYNFRADLDKFAVYTIGNTGDFIIFYPETTYLKKEKAYFEEYGLKH